MEIKKYFIKQNEEIMSKFYITLEKVIKIIQDDSLIVDICKGIILCENTNNLLNRNDISFAEVVKAQAELCENLKPLVVTIDKKIDSFL